MAYFSMHAYDADVWITGFAGLRQADILMNPNPNYAAEAENVETPNGVLQPQADCPLTIPIVDENDPTHLLKIETLAFFHRRWMDQEGSHDWYIACSGGKFYYRQSGTDLPWTQIAMPSGMSAFQSSVWSWVTYEDEGDNDEDSPVDVLILSNAVDGMIKITPPDRYTTWDDIDEFTWGDVDDGTWDDLQAKKWTINTIENGTLFGVIERFQERVWGTAIAEDPDMLVYSKPYNPTNFDPDAETPDEGGGDISQPTWDGDKFTALKRYGSQLLAFKKNSIWKITGVYPGEFSMYEQYGDGTIYHKTIAVKDDKVYFVTDKGMCIYDGMSSSPFMRKFVEKIWNDVNKAALDKMCGTIFDNRYYLALPLGDSTDNNALLVYDFTEGSFLLYKDIYVETLLPTDEELIASSSTGEVFVIGYDSWLTGKASGRPVRWVSPWMDFGYKRIQKGGFDLYFVPEVKDKPVTLNFTMETEKKKKSKSYTVNPLSGDKTEHKGKRLHFSGNGRKFRLIIETDEGVTDPWRLIGGVQMVVETDPD